MPEKYNRLRKGEKMIIGVIAAMENELRPFINHFPTQQEVNDCYNTFYINQSERQTLVAVCSGRGKVNATVFTQQMISKFSPELIINIGVSGGIAEDSQVEDIYVGTSHCHYDVRLNQSKNTFPNKLYYHGDTKIIDLMTQIEPSVKRGIFGTGEGFVSDETMREQLSSQFKISAVDMESAAIAQCCYLNDVRFVSLRGICDKADANSLLTTDELQENISSKLMVVINDLLKQSAFS